MTELYHTVAIIYRRQKYRRAYRHTTIGVTIVKIIVVIIIRAGGLIYYCRTRKVARCPMDGATLIGEIEVFHHSSTYQPLLGRAIFYAVHAIPSVEQSYARTVLEGLLEITSYGAAIA